MSAPQEPDPIGGLTRRERADIAAAIGERVDAAGVATPTLSMLAALLWIGLRRGLPGLSWDDFLTTPLAVLAPRTQTARRRAAERWRTGGDDVG